MPLRLLEAVGRRGAPVLAIGVLLGLLLPPVAELFRPLLVPVIFINLVLALLRLDFAEIAAFRRQPTLVGLFTLFLLLASPVAMWAAIQPFALTPGLAAALVLMAAAPPIASAPAFALVMGLNAAFSVFVVLVSHMVVPLTLPPMALYLLGLDIDIGFLDLTGRLVLFIGGSFAAAWALKRWVFSPAFLARQNARIDGLAVLGLVIFAIAIMDGVTATILERPGFALLVVVCAFAGNIGLQVIGALAFWRAGRRIALTAGHMAGNCNMGLVLAVLADRADPDTVTFFALAQLPMYMLPSVAVPIYRRLIRD